MCPNNIFALNIFSSKTLAPLAPLAFAQSRRPQHYNKAAALACVLKRVLLKQTSKTQDWDKRRTPLGCHTLPLKLEHTFQRMEPFSSLPSSAASSSESCSSDSLTDFKSLVYDADLLNLDLDQVSLLAFYSFFQSWRQVSNQTRIRLAQYGTGVVDNTISTTTTATTPGASRNKTKSATRTKGKNAR